MLREAVADGFRDPVRLRSDPDLGPLRSSPEFPALILDLEFPAVHSRAMSRVSRAIRPVGSNGPYPARQPSSPTRIAAGPARSGCRRPRPVSHIAARSAAGSRGISANVRWIRPPTECSQKNQGTCIMSRAAILRMTGSRCRNLWQSGRTRMRRSSPRRRSCGWKFGSFGACKIAAKQAGPCEQYRDSEVVCALAIASPRTVKR